MYVSVSVDLQVIKSRLEIALNKKCIPEFAPCLCFSRNELELEHIVEWCMCAVWCEL